jgi:hypothetical protein
MVLIDRRGASQRFDKKKGVLFASRANVQSHRKKGRVFVVESNEGKKG